MYIGEDAFVCLAGLSAEIGSVPFRREYLGGYAGGMQARQQTGQAGDVIEVAVGQRYMHGRGMASPDGRQGFGQHAARFRPRIDDDHRHRRVFNDMDVFPYGAYTQYVYHARP